MSPSVSLATPFGADELAGEEGRGLRAFLNEYLGTAAVPVPFGGRDTQMEALDAWLLDTSSSRSLVVADAGRGKSALLAQWAATVESRGMATVAFVPVSVRFGTAARAAVSRLLQSRIAVSSAQREKHPGATTPHTSVDADLRDLVASLGSDRVPGLPPLLVVFDALDEATDWTAANDLAALKTPGHGVKVVASARTIVGVDAAGWAARLGWTDRCTFVDLPLLDRRGLREILAHSGSVHAAESAHPEWLDQLVRVTQGDPLVVRLFLDALRDTASITPGDFARVTPGLAGYFDRWWRELGSSTALNTALARAVLATLACAFGPLARDELTVICGPDITRAHGSESPTRSDTRAQIDGVLKALARLLVGDPDRGGVSFVHPRLGYHTLEGLDDAQRAVRQGALISFCRSAHKTLVRGEVLPGDVPGYVVRHYGAHLDHELARAPVGSTLRREIACELHALASHVWMRAWKAHTGCLDGFVTDLTRSWREADRVFKHAAPNGAERSWAMTVQARCRAVFDRAARWEGRVSGSLTAALVREGLWSPEVALANIKRVGTNESLALEKLVPELPEHLVWEALALAKTAERAAPDCAARTFSAIALRLAALGYPLEAVATARLVRWARVRTDLVRELVNHVPETMRDEIVDDAADLVRTAAINKQFPFLPAGRLSQLVSLRSPGRRADALAEARRYVEVLSKELHGNQDFDPWYELALAYAHAHQTDAVRDALARIWDITPPHAYADAAVLLPEPDRTVLAREGLALVKNEDQCWPRLFEAFASVSESAADEALVLLRALHDTIPETDRAQSLVLIAPQTTENTREKLYEEAWGALAKLPPVARAEALDELGSIDEGRSLNTVLEWRTRTAGAHAAWETVLNALSVNEAAGERLYRFVFQHAPDEFADKAGDLAALLEPGEWRGVIGSWVTRAARMPEAAKRRAGEKIFARARALSEALWEFEAWSSVFTREARREFVLEALEKAREILDVDETARWISAAIDTIGTPDCAVLADAAVRVGRAGKGLAGAMALTSAASAIPVEDSRRGVWLSEALELLRHSGDGYGAAWRLSNLVRIALESRDPAPARALLVQMRRPCNTGFRWEKWWNEAVKLSVLLPESDGMERTAREAVAYALRTNPIELAEMPDVLAAFPPEARDGVEQMAIDAVRTRGCLDYEAARIVRVLTTGRPAFLSHWLPVVAAGSGRLLYQLDGLVTLVPYLSLAQMQSLLGTALSTQETFLARYASLGRADEAWDIAWKECPAYERPSVTVAVALATVDPAVREVRLHEALAVMRSADRDTANAMLTRVVSQLVRAGYGSLALDLLDDPVVQLKPAMWIYHIKSSVMPDEWPEDVRERLSARIARAVTAYVAAHDAMWDEGFGYFVESIHGEVLARVWSMAFSCGSPAGTHAVYHEWRPPALHRLADTAAVIDVALWTENVDGWFSPHEDRARA